MRAERRNTSESGSYKTERVVEAYHEVLTEPRNASIGGRRENLTPHLSKADIYERVRVKVGFYDSIQTISRIIRTRLKEQKKG
ncbi:MAG: hypothetical protein LBG19_12865 [Prevotellaceae bacterium]|jgi:hypothetical protein|nr:hypothetical protein [Prevotellaceae bacterium]